MNAQELDDLQAEMETLSIRSQHLLKFHRPLLISIHDPNFSKELPRIESNLRNSLAYYNCEINNGVSFNLAFAYGLPNPKINNSIAIFKNGNFHLDFMIYPIGQYIAIKDLIGSGIEFVKQEKDFSQLLDMNFLSLPNNDYLIAYSESARHISAVAATSKLIKSSSVTTFSKPKKGNLEIGDNQKNSSSSLLGRKYLARTVIYQYSNKKKTILEHFFEEPIDIIQTYIDDKVRIN